MLEASRPRVDRQPAVNETSRPGMALQTPKPTVRTAPTWSDPHTITPQESEAEGPLTPSAKEPGLDLLESDTNPLVLPDGASEVMPAVPVPAGDSSVFVVEPEAAVLPPGAEAFFETIELVNPPQL